MDQQSTVIPVTDLSRLPREAVVASMPDELQNVFRQIVPILEHEQNLTRETERALGGLILPVAKHPALGRHHIELLAVACRVDASRLIRAAWYQFLFPTEAQVDKLLARRGCNGYAMTFAHITQLLATPTRPYLDRITEEAFARCLTVRELAGAIRSSAARTKREVQRHQAEPRAIKSLCSDLEADFKTLQNHVRNAVDYGIVQRLSKTPDPFLTDAELSDISCLRQCLEQLFHELDGPLNRLKRFEKDLAQRIRPGPDSLPALKSIPVPKQRTTMPRKGAEVLTDQNKPKDCSTRPEVRPCSRFQNRSDGNLA